MTTHPRSWPISAWLSVALLAITLTAGGMASYLAPGGSDDQSLASRLKPPLWRSPTESLHVLGTDELGRDVLVRIIYGARVSMAVGISGVLIGSAVGVALGLLAGLYRGWLELLVMRIGDVQLAFPYLLLAIAILAVVGPSLPALIAVLSIRTWVVYARTVRAAVLSLMGREFTQAARALGARPQRIALRHLLPNVVAPITVLATAELGSLILLESTLSFLGIGVQPPMPSWGSMLSSGRAYLTNAWWIATFPGGAMLLVVLAVNVLGDWLRDNWDPRMQRTSRDSG
jgi:peptide/nickel transport system permease protein